MALDIPRGRDIISVHRKKTTNNQVKDDNVKIAQKKPSTASGTRVDSLAPYRGLNFNWHFCSAIRLGVQIHFDCQISTFSSSFVECVCVCDNCCLSFFSAHICLPWTPFTRQTLHIGTIIMLKRHSIACVIYIFLYRIQFVRKSRKISNSCWKYNFPFLNCFSSRSFDIRVCSLSRGFYHEWGSIFIFASTFST